MLRWRREEKWTLSLQLASTKDKKNVSVTIGSYINDEGSINGWVKRRLRESLLAASSRLYFFFDQVFFFYSTALLILL